MPRNYDRAEINRLSAELLRERQRSERLEALVRRVARLSPDGMLRSLVEEAREALDRGGSQQ